MASSVIARHTRAGHSADDVHAVANGLRSTLVELSRWLGPEGCRALVERAMNRSSEDYPALGTLEVVTHSAPAVAGLDEAIQAHGASIVSAGLNSTLIQLFEILERVIGDDLTKTLAERITDGEPSDTGEKEP
jgi:hypothetical protein